MYAYWNTYIVLPYVNWPTAKVYFLKYSILYEAYSDFI